MVDSTSSPINQEHEILPNAQKVKTFLSAQNSSIKNKAENLFKKGSVKVSFEKGSLKKSFLVAAIVHDNKIHNTQVKMNSSGELKTSCDCLEWSEESGCVHTTATLLKFSFSQSMLHGDLDDNELRGIQIRNTKPIPYGHIITHLNQISVAQVTQNDFLNYHYRLKDGRYITPKTSTPLNGQKIYITAKKVTKESPVSSTYIGKYYLSFSLQTSVDNQPHEFINIMGPKFLFDWQTGTMFELDSDLTQALSSIIKEKTIYFDLDRLNITLNKMLKSNHVYLEIDHDCKLEARFLPSQIKSDSYELHLEMYSNQLLSPPDIFSLFSFENGVLAGFKRKSLGVDYIDRLFKGDNETLKKLGYQCSDRSYLESLTQLFDPIMCPRYLSIDDEFNLHSIDSVKIINILRDLYQSFGVDAFRFSKLTHHSYVITISKTLFLEGISRFYKLCSEQSIQLTFNQKQIKSWKGQARLERKKSKTNWFSLQLDMSHEDYKMIKKLDLNSGTILDDGELFILDKDDLTFAKYLKKFTSQQEQTTKDSKQHSFIFHLNRSQIFDLFELYKLGLDSALTEDEIELCQSLANLKEMPKSELPQMKNVTLRDYQENGYHWLSFLYKSRLGACLADDMGLGKTLQTITFLKGIQDKIKKVLIAVPVSILLNWQKEIEGFSDLSLQVYYGQDRKRIDPDKLIILTSFGILKKEALTTFREEHFDVFIMDEVQHLKNIKSKGALSARHIKADFRICLTGTPVENDISEFYNIMDLSLPGIWGDLSLIRGSQDKNKRLMVRQSARPFILRRTKKEVLKELPPKNEQIINLSFSDDERKVYDSKLKEIQEKILSQSMAFGDILSNLLRLRQLCLWQSGAQIMSTKINFLMEGLETLIQEGHQVLVFSQFTTYLDHIEKKIKDHHWKYSRIDGKQTFKTRQKEVEKFQSSETSIFLISLKAGGVGLNLTQASYIYLMDPWWNPAVENQAVDRAYRIGQKNHLTVYRPIIENSVEEKVLELQSAKKELFHDLMGDSEDNVYSGKLTSDDFKYVLGMTNEEQQMSDKYDLD